MAANDSPASERLNMQVVNLLTGVSLHGDQHLAEVERDLVQMNVLLDEAIKKLCASFMAIHRAVDLQQDVLDGLRADGVPAPETAARFEALRGEISQHVGAAVTGLQFQDMTSQLIGRMVQHLAGLREVFGALDTNGAVLPESDNEALLAALRHISEQVGTCCSEQAGGVRSTVNQRHMDSGDIELF
ncbi:MAG: chemotaxis protein [Thiobacillus sp.]